MVLPQLPAELITSIFDILAAQNDWDTMRACSLLSSHYSFLVRQHLFSTVRLQLTSHISIKDVVRRVRGLCQLLQRNTYTNRFIKTLEILDCYPVYDSQWITQQSCLPHLISLLENVQSCTFGCEVGYLAWSSFTPELQISLRNLFVSPQLIFLNLRNLGAVPEVILRNALIRYLYLNDVSIFSSDEHTESQHDDSQHLSQDLAYTQLVYLNIRTVSAENTESVSRLIESQGNKLKTIKWRCWEGNILISDRPTLSLKNKYFRCSVKFWLDPSWYRRYWRPFISPKTFFPTLVRKHRARSNRTM